MLGTPQHVVLAELAGQKLHFPGNSRVAWLGLPAPVKPKGRRVPFLDSGGLHEVGKVFPAIDGFGQQNPEQAEGGREAGPWVFLLLDPLTAAGELAFGDEEPCCQDGCEGIIRPGRRCPRIGGLARRTEGRKAGCAWRW